MARIKQVQITFVPVEDRLLLRLNTTAREEFRFWITRRYARLLWPLLERALAADPVVAAQTGPAERRTVLSFRQQQALSKADFTHPFEAGHSRLPLGEQPVLLARAQLRNSAPTPVLALHPERGAGIDLALDSELLHSFARLLGETMQRAQWELAPVPVMDPDGEQSPTRTLN